jgi:hypothetical protein
MMSVVKAMRGDPKKKVDFLHDILLILTADRVNNNLHVCLH